MRIANLLVAILVFGIPLSADAQSNKILGRIRINPPVNEPINVTIQLHNKSNELIGEILVDSTMPYRFNDVAPSNDELTIRVSVTSPKGYFSSQPQYTKLACCPFDRDIPLKRPVDLYIDSIRRAEQAKSPQAAIDALTTGERHAITVSQKLEIKRQLGSLYAEQGDYEKQQMVMANFSDIPSAQKLDPLKKQVYWGERLDGFLNWMNYSSLRIPEQDFGKLLVQASNQDRLDVWKKLLEDFRVAHPEVALDLSTSTDKEITSQLKIIKNAIRP